MNCELNVFALILGASLPVKLVLGILIGFSIASWFIIFRKKALIDRANAGADEFEERFWSGADLAGLFSEITVRASASPASTHLRSRIPRIRAACASAAASIRARCSKARSARCASPRRARSTGSNRTSSSSPTSARSARTSACFGTVWGIMIAFQGLANVKEATIAMVAPGISEALIATAMGLFAAIPAVWAYNRFSTKLERISTRYETFVEEFSSILQRQAHVDDVV